MSFKTRRLVVLSLALMLAVLLGLAVGAVWLSPAEVVRALGADGPSDGDPMARTIVWELRLPRALLAACVGAGLAAAGTAYQGLFRNPLAEPFVIGTASGAALGLVNAAVVGSGALLQPLVGLLLDLQWDGALVSGARIYTREAYALAFAVILAGALAWLTARRPDRRRLILTTVGLLLAFELLPAPRTLYSAEVPAVYREIARDPRDRQ